MAGPFGTGDYAFASGNLVIPAGALGGTVTVQVHADAIEEPAPDKVFYVDLSSPSGATLLKTRGVGTIRDDDAPYPGVIGLSIVADGTGPGAGQGRNRLQWLYPTAPQPIQQFRIRWNQSAGSCTSPDPNDPTGGFAPTITQAPGAGPTEIFPHTPLDPGVEYCYTVWLDYGGGNFSLPGVTGKARPFDATGPVKWKLFSGMTMLAAPTVGFDAVIGFSNTRYVQAMRRGPGGGTWPAPWKPISLSDLAQHRVPIVPVAGVSRAFITTQDGWVHAVDTSNGNLLWATQLTPNAAMGAPAVILTAFGGAQDYVLAGTSAADDNRIYALDPFTGAVIDYYDMGGGIGAILGTGAVDYQKSRVYFGSRKGSNNGTLWCLDLGPPSDALSLGWMSTAPGDVNGSPVLRGDKVYVGALPDTVWAKPKDTGVGGYSRALGDGEPKGFLFPDRSSPDLYVATNGKVWGLVDDGSAFPNKWLEIELADPSIVLFAPGTTDLYVGVRDYGGNAALVKINTATGSVASSVALEPGVPMVVGPPSLDIGFDFVHVGSEAGVLYGVELPF
jgi:hypothetical protein